MAQDIKYSSSIPFNVRLPRDIKRQFVEVCQKQGSSAANEARKMVFKFLEENQAKKAS